MMLLRTAKSCGPDAPTLVSSLRKVFRRRRWQQSPVTGESAKETVKTIAQGRPGHSGEPVATTLVCSTLFCTRGCGCSGHPAFPAPSVLFGAQDSSTTRALERRGNAGACLCDVIARSNATKQSILSLRGEMDCFAELVIGRAFTQSVGSQRWCGRPPTASVCQTGGVI
jgi:hypothetical protein